jgi:nuclear pore complex protein Nup98-Nup96
MSEEELAAVSDFAVSRPGHGSIRWPGDSDLRGLDLGATLRIAHGDVMVYAQGPEASGEGADITASKPQPGEGLNKRAVINIFGMSPESMAAGGGEVVGLQWAQQLEQLLREHTATMGAKWVGYDPIQGVWRFEVESI